MPQVENVSLGGGQIAMLQTVTQLSSAQILALSATPITLVPAPPAGKIIAVFGAALVYHFGAHRYNAPAGDALNLQYAGSDNDPVTGPVTFLLVQAASGFYYVSGTTTATGDILPGDDAQAIELIASHPYNAGPITASTLGAGGAGYVANDTGTITNGANDATYKVLTVGAGGAVLTYQITGAGTACTVANGNATVDGGAQPGVGAGFTINITAVQTGDGTLKVVTYYQIIPVP